MSYNTQNIFDDSDNGSEYPEFDPSNGNWGTSQYNTRLANLAEVIRRSTPGGPDVIALQEIENKRVAQDLVDGYLKGLGYNYIVVTHTDGSAIQIGLISKLLLDKIRVHKIVEDGKTIGRPILEAAIVTDKGTLHVFNNHWKSKLGGAEETEPARIAASALLSRRINELYSSDSAVEIVVLGDFNENWDEYCRNNGEYITGLIPEADTPDPNLSGPILIAANVNEFLPGGSSCPVVLYSPWCTYSEAEGSYEYNNEWDTIDNALFNQAMFDGTGFEFEGFRVVAEDFLINSQGAPLSWKTKTGNGYSDHLPILVVLKQMP